MKQTSLRAATTPSRPPLLPPALGAGAAGAPVEAPAAAGVAPDAGEAEAVDSCFADCATWSSAAVGRHRAPWDGEIALPPTYDGPRGRGGRCPCRRCWRGNHLGRFGRGRRTLLREYRGRGGGGSIGSPDGRSGGRTGLPPRSRARPRA